MRKYLLNNTHLSSMIRGMSCVVYPKNSIWKLMELLMSNKYTCFICRKEKTLGGNIITELDENECLICPACAEVVERLTGEAGREVEVDE
jgi:hypothetical protein